MREFSFPTEIDNVLVSLGNQREDFVKKAVIEKAQREGFLNRSAGLSESESKRRFAGDRPRRWNYKKPRTKAVNPRRSSFQRQMLVVRAFRSPTGIDNILNSLGKQQEDFVKKAVIEKAQREGLLKTSPQISASVPTTGSIGDKLSRRERIFFEGPANLSERGVRKSIAHDTVDERHQPCQ